jgi:hypothetical protein
MMRGLHWLVPMCGTLIVWGAPMVPETRAADAPMHLRISLIHGQNQNIHDNLEECAKFRQSLTKLFGYQLYERLGTATAQVSVASPAYLQPSWAFGMKVEADATVPNLYHYELFQEKQPMFKGKFIPKDQVPLIIRGPQYNTGILILVVYKETP